MRNTYTPNEIRALAKKSGPQWESEVRAALVFAADLLDAADAAVKSTQPSNEVYGWMIDGSSHLLRGEFAEADAKSEAKRCGGTCKAYPVYTKPQPVAGLTPEEVKALVEACADEQWPGVGHVGWTPSDAEFYGRVARAVLAAQRGKA